MSNRTSQPLFPFNVRNHSFFVGGAPGGPGAGGAKPLELAADPGVLELGGFGCIPTGRGSASRFEGFGAMAPRRPGVPGAVAEARAEPSVVHSVTEIRERTGEDP